MASVITDVSFVSEFPQWPSLFCCERSQSVALSIAAFDSFCIERPSGIPVKRISFALRLGNRKNRIMKIRVMSFMCKIIAYMV